MMKSVAAIRHVAFEDLGYFESVLEDAGYWVRYYDAGVDDLKILIEEDPDLLFVLGGPIGAYEEDRYPFLTEELALISARLEANRPLVGICLGAQLIARSLGSKVYPGRAKEIGFAPIELTEPGYESCLKHLAGTRLLHWHGDTFDLPSGAIRLASTSICRDQAFSYGTNTIAFQFHPEAGGNGFERWLIGHTMELSTLGIDVNQLRREWHEASEDLAARSKACLKDWLFGR
jgi:GMP synthase (glutamine-hydrolysing)